MNGHFDTSKASSKILRFYSEVLLPRLPLFGEPLNSTSSFSIECSIYSPWGGPSRISSAHRGGSLDSSLYNSKWLFARFSHLLRGGFKFFMSTRQTCDVDVPWTRPLYIMFLVMDRIFSCSVRQTNHLYREADICPTFLAPWYFFRCTRVAVPRSTLFHSSLLSCDLTLCLRLICSRKSPGALRW